MTDPLGMVASSLRGALAELEGRVRAFVDEKVQTLRQELVALVEARAAAPRFVSVERACELFGFSRSTWDRWLADPASGLAALVVRPTGPNGRVLVPLAEFDAWFRRRGTGPAVAHDPAA